MMMVHWSRTYVGLGKVDEHAPETIGRFKVRGNDVI